MRSLYFVFILIFTAGISAQSSSVRVPFDEATRFARSGDFEKALPGYHRALDAAAGERISKEFLTKLYYNLGVCEYRLEHHDKAIGHLEHAIDLSSGSYMNAYYALGMANSAIERWSAARAAFWRSLENNNRDGEAWFDMAMARLGDEDLEGAEFAFHNAVEFKSVDTALAHNNIGVLLALRNEMTEAIKEFEAAIAVSDGKLAIAKGNLDHCRSSSGLRSEFKLARRQRYAY